MDTTSVPSFLTTDQTTITNALVSAFESNLGKTLYDTQVERIILDMMAYRESLVRLAIQSAAAENLVDFATGSRLEALGRLVGVTTRIAAEAATCPWQISLSATSTSDTTISSGLEATDGNGLTWKTTADLTIPAGSLSGAVAAQCETAGTSGNGLASGSSFSALTGNYTIISTAVSAGGAAEETDTALRTRILAAPFGFSSAGPAKAYRYHTLNVDSTIVDAAVVNGGSGIVQVYPLTSSGLPSETLKASILSALSAESVRPLCDTVQVLSPTQVSYAITASVVIYSTAVRATVLAALEAAAAAYVADRASALGQDLIGSQVIAKLGAVDGVYSVALSGWTDQVLDDTQWASGSYAVNITGTAVG